MTVRRWVAASPAEAWKRLADLEAMVAAEPGLDLIEPFATPGVLVTGESAVLAQREGHRETRLRLDVATDEEPAHLAAALTARDARWLLTVDVTPLDEGMSDICLRAQREAAGGGHRLPAVTKGAHRRVTEAVETLLEALADHVEGPAGRVQAVPEPT